MNRIKSLLVIGREWFDKVNGNSYHSAEIFLNGKFLCKSGINYGYGDGYSQTAISKLRSLNYLKDLIKYDNGGCESLTRYCERKNIVLETRKIEGLKKSQL